MAKYSYIELDIKAGKLTGVDKLNNNKKSALENNNAIYIYRGRKSGKVYIGQTKHFIRRHQEHFSGNEEKFNNASFDKVVILFSVYFNGSALDDVERQLITYFVADKFKPRSRKQDVTFDTEVINLTAGNTVNDYRDRDRVSSEVVLPFWENYLYPEWVHTKKLDELRTSELVKYSPIKTLTEQQQEVIEDVLKNHDRSYVINGDAGTGKTVLLTYLVAELLNETNRSIAIVVQPNWLKTAEEIFKLYGMDEKRLTITTSTRLIKQNESYDVIIVDEAHKLSRRYGKQHPSFNEVYKASQFSNYNSHLEIIKTLGRQVVLMYDVLQAIRPANVTRERFRELTANFEQRYLTTQFRIKTPDGKKYTSDDYINGIKWLLYKDTDLLELTNFNPQFDRDIFNDKSEDAYFGYFSDKPLHNLFNWIEEDRNYNPNHINRVLGGLVEPWLQKDGKDPKKMHWFEGEMQKRWNSTQENWINSTDADSEDQIGSVFAVQGIDLNKVGVLIGNDLKVDNTGKLYADPENFFNVNGKFSEEDLKDPQNRKEFTLFVLNIYYVLLTRGIDGIRVGFWKNREFEKYMKDTLGII